MAYNLIVTAEIEKLLENHVDLCHWFCPINVASLV